MSTPNEFPQIMANAREDLAGNIGGQFSPEDWKKILTRAQEQLEKAQGSQNAWVDVIRDFHREGYWGFTPDYKKPKVKPQKKNLGVVFIWFTFQALTLTIIAVVWLGQIYTASDDPIDKWLFFATIAITLANVGFFLWRHGNHSDE